MELNTEKLLEIIEDPSRDGLAKTLAGFLISAEEEFEKLRQTLLVLARQADDVVTIAESIAQLDPILTESTKNLKKIVAALERGEQEDPVAHEFTFKGDTCSATITHWGARVLAESMVGALKKKDGYYNFMEWTFTHPSAGALVVTAQRKLGKTAVDLLKEANARIAQLELELDKGQK